MNLTEAYRSKNFLITPRVYKISHGPVQLKRYVLRSGTESDLYGKTWVQSHQSFQHMHAHTQVRIL